MNHGQELQYSLFQQSEQQAIQRKERWYIDEQVLTFKANCVVVQYHPKVDDFDEKLEHGFDWRTYSRTDISNVYSAVCIVFEAFN